jgi:hypothetical protein
VNSILQHTTNSIPNELSLRAENHTLYVLLLIMLSILLLATAKLSNTKSFRIVFETALKGVNLEQYLRDNMRTNSFASISLLFNYYVGICVLFFLALNKLFAINFITSIIVAGISPFLIYVYETIGVFLVGLITGEYKRIKNILLVTNTTNQLSGLLFFLIALFWTLNPAYGVLFLKLSLLIFLIKVFFRSSKAIYINLSNGIPLYYIILYFCTLEILPVIVTSYFFWDKLTSLKGFFN